MQYKHKIYEKKAWILWRRMLFKSIDGKFVPGFLGSIDGTLETSIGWYRNYHHQDSGVYYTTSVKSKTGKRLARERAKISAMYLNFNRITFVDNISCQKTKQKTILPPCAHSLYSFRIIDAHIGINCVEGTCNNAVAKTLVVR